MEQLKRPKNVSEAIHFWGALIIDSFIFNHYFQYIAILAKHLITKIPKVINIFDLWDTF